MLVLWNFCNRRYKKREVLLQGRDLGLFHKASDILLNLLLRKELLKLRRPGIVVGKALCGALAFKLHNVPAKARFHGSLGKFPGLKTSKTRGKVLVKEVGACPGNKAARRCGFPGCQRTVP